MDLWFTFVPYLDALIDQTQKLIVYISDYHSIHIKVLLKTRIHKIGRENLPIRSCSDHFVSAAKRKLRPDEYPTQVYWCAVMQQPQSLEDLPLLGLFQCMNRICPLHKFLIEQRCQLILRVKILLLSEPGQLR